MHHGADHSHEGSVDDGSRPHRLEDFGLAGDSPLDIDVVVVSDQPRRPADLLHHGIARIDAEAALDADKLSTVANVDTGRTDRHTLVAVDAVADFLAERPQDKDKQHQTTQHTAVVL